MVEHSLDGAAGRYRRTEPLHTSFRRFYSGSVYPPGRAYTWQSQRLMEHGLHRDRNVLYVWHLWDCCDVWPDRGLGPNVQARLLLSAWVRPHSRSAFVGPCRMEDGLHRSAKSSAAIRALSFIIHHTEVDHRGVDFGNRSTSTTPVNQTGRKQCPASSPLPTARRRQVKAQSCTLRSQLRHQELLAPTVIIYSRKMGTRFSTPLVGISTLCLLALLVITWFGKFGRFHAVYLKSCSEMQAAALLTSSDVVRRWRLQHHTTTRDK